MPTVQSVHTNRPLLDLLLANYQDQNDFVTQRGVPTIAGSNKSDEYYIFDLGDLNRLESKARAAGTEAAQGNYKIAKDTFNCQQYSIKNSISRQELSNADMPLNPFIDAMDYLNQQNLMKSETVWRDACFLPGIWDTDLLGVASGVPTAGQFLRWDAVGSDPLGDISSKFAAVKKSGGKRPNRFYVSEDVYDVLRNHPDITSRFQYTGTGAGAQNPVTRQMLAGLIDVSEVIVGGGLINTAPEGQPVTHEYILGKHALLCYVNPEGQARQKQPSAFYAYVWRDANIGGDANGMAVRQFRNEDKDVTFVEADLFIDHKLTGVGMGCFFGAAIS